MKHPSDLARPGFEPRCYKWVANHATDDNIKILCRKEKNIFVLIAPMKISHLTVMTSFPGRTGAVNPIVTPPRPFPFHTTN